MTYKIETKKRKTSDDRRRYSYTLEWCWNGSPTYASTSAQLSMSLMSFASVASHFALTLVIYTHTQKSPMAFTCRSGAKCLNILISRPLQQCEKACVLTIFVLPRNPKYPFLEAGLPQVPVSLKKNQLFQC